MLITENECIELLKEIESKCQDAKRKKIELNRLKTQITAKVSTSDSFVVEDNNPKEVETIDYLDEIIEDEFSFYLDNYKAIGDNFTYEDIISILPPKDNFDYHDIANRLIAESYKEIKEINELMFEDDMITSDELKEYRDLIEKENTKIKYIRMAIKEDVDSQLKQEIKNKIVLMPTTAGNIRIIDELEHIAIDYYDSFLELINSIIDGNFKNVKTFGKNKELTGISEVKGFKTRVVFSRIDKHTYALITAFVKKSNTDKLYVDQLKGKVSHFKENEQLLKNKLKDEKFMEDNDFYVECLFDLLSPKEKNPEFKKVITND